MTFYSFSFIVAFYKNPMIILRGYKNKGIDGDLFNKNFCERVVELFKTLVTEYFDHGK